MSILEIGLHGEEKMTPRLADNVSLSGLPVGHTHAEVDERFMSMVIDGRSSFPEQVSLLQFFWELL